MVWAELHSHMPLQQRPRFYIPLESTFFFSMSTAMSSMTGNHTMDSFTCWKRTFKTSCLTHWWWEGASRIYLIYKGVRCHKGDSEEYGRTYYNGLNHTLLAELACRACLLACTKVSGVFSQYILRSRSLWNPLSSRMLKNMQIFLLIISKFLSLYNLV